MRCPHSNSCSGCISLHIPLTKQQTQKKLKLQDLTSLPIEVISLGESSLRTRGELVLDKDVLGFVHSETKKVVPISECPLWTPDLNEYFKEILNLNLKISSKGSLRIRANKNLKGLWLDFSNLEIKELLESQVQLLKLMDLGLVEIGQKRKRLKLSSSRLKLEEPELSPWSQSFSLRKTYDLYHSIGNFSQTGEQANRKIGEWVANSLDSNDRVLEFGSGIGTLTLPALETAAKVLSLEYDKLATESLNFTLGHYPELKNKWSYKIGNFQKIHELNWEEFNCLIINPPRSGMGDFLGSLFKISKELRPKKILYMSCYFDSFKKDISQLQDLGFELTQIKILDQFPHTDHFEILSELKLLRN